MKLLHPTSMAFPVLAILMACTEAPGAEQEAISPTTNSTSVSVKPGSITGEWRILSIDGKDTVSLEGQAKIPRLAFGEAGYSGTSGCNAFGGMGLQIGARYYTAPGPQTQIGCPDPLARQETALNMLLFGASTVSWIDPQKIHLVGNGHEAIFALENAPRMAPLEYAQQRLEATSWRVQRVDLLDVSAWEMKLHFDAAQWEMRSACAASSGAWRQEGSQLVDVTISTPSEACSSDAGAIESAFAAIMRASPRVATGPNGELLMAGGGHWLIGQRDE